jgi:hypothetical protein
MPRKLLGRNLQLLKFAVFLLLSTMISRWSLRRKVFPLGLSYDSTFLIGVSKF